MAAPESPTRVFGESKSPPPTPHKHGSHAAVEVSACSDQMEAGYGGNELEPGNLTALLQADGFCEVVPSVGMS